MRIKPILHIVYETEEIEDEKYVYMYIYIHTYPIMAMYVGRHLILAQFSLSTVENSTYVLYNHGITQDSKS